MSETRRQLFKTSIMSGFGLMAASSIAKAAGGRKDYVVVRTTDAEGKPNGSSVLFQFGLDDVYAFNIVKVGGKTVPDKPFDIQATLLDTNDFDLRRIKNATIYVDGNPVQFTSGGITLGEDLVARPTWNEIGGKRFECLDTGKK